MGLARVAMWSAVAPASCLRITQVPQQSLCHLELGCKTLFEHEQASQHTHCLDIHTLICALVGRLALSHSLATDTCPLLTRYSPGRSTT